MPSRKERSDDDGHCTSGELDASEPGDEPQAAQPQPGQLGALGAGLTCCGPRSTRRPNILYIMTDDHAVGEMSCYGNRVLHTPNMDRLAAGGARFSNAFVTLEVEGVTDADALGNNPIHAEGRLVGRATGGNYGFRVGKSLALAVVRPEFSEVGTALEITILGTRHPVTVISESPYDPENARLRS